MSLSRDLCVGSVDAIVDRLGLVEQPGDGTPEFLQLTSPMVPDKPVGTMRIFRKPDVCDLCYVGLTVDTIGLDSHMLFAFTRPGSPVPHFTVDSVWSEPFFAEHLDLIPKVDLGANLAYMDYCFTPLTEILERGKAIEGLDVPSLSPRQHAVMSAWMFVNRADETAFKELSSIVDEYRDHWFGLIEQGVPDSALGGATAAQMAERDRRNRAIIFNADVDPVWAQVARLIGDEQSERVRTTLAAPLP